MVDSTVLGMQSFPANGQLSAPMIQVQDVIKTFKNAAGEFTVLKGVNLTIRRGQFVSIIGKSGSGKSTLINMVTGIDYPSSGQVIIGETNLYKMNESERSLWRGRNLGIVFQFFQLLPMLTLLENVMLPMDYANMYTFDERKTRAMDLLRLVGLEDYAGKLPLAVSTGQQQSAAIARALANDPPLIVADEPTGNLDSRSAIAIIELFEALVEQGKTIVMVTHDPSLTARTDRTIILSDGELISEAVAQSLPLLSHRQMMDVTKQSQYMVFQPGETIIDCGQHVELFYMIEKGCVDIILSGRGKDARNITATLSPGAFFGEVELLKGGKAIASVRASQDEPVELLALSRGQFLELVKNSALTEDAIGHIVQQRLKENKAGRRPGWLNFGRSKDRKGA
ncbi:MAG: ATP-binding cassette domain-containing protein [Anaerolineales bacterium]|nr:ATP-binding cassette domain-containing protein [Anaerolineales bacterium]